MAGGSPPHLIWQVATLEALRAAALEKGEGKGLAGVHYLTSRIDNANDALRRAQSVERLIKYSHRLPRES